MKKLYVPAILFLAHCTPVDSGSNPVPPGPISAATTWTPKDGPYVIEADVVIDNTTLTIEPCTEIILSGGGIEVSGTNAKLVARGTADCPITFRSTTPGDKSVLANHAGFIDLEYVNLVDVGGVADAFRTGAITLLHDDTDNNYSLPHVDALRVRHVTIKGATKYGVALLGNGTFTADSEDLVISGSAAEPVSFEVRNLIRLPPGTYTGNGVDEILIQTWATPVVPMHLVNRGVPYRVTNFGTASTTWVNVGDFDGNTTTLTIDPGVTLKMDPNTGISIRTGSSLIAAGTQDAPIQLVAATSTAWHGLVYGGYGTGMIASSNKISHARIENTGSDFGSGTSTWCHCTKDGSQACNEYAAIIFDDAPESAFITDTVISGSQGHGIDHGYFGPPVAFPTVTFEGIAKCEQTTPAALDMTCDNVSVTCP